MGGFIGKIYPNRKGFVHVKSKIIIKNDKIVFSS